MEIVSLLVSTTQWWQKYLCYLGASVDKSRVRLKNPSTDLSQTQTQTKLYAI